MAYLHFDNAAHPQQHRREEDQDPDEDGAEGVVEAGRVILLQGVLVSMPQVYLALSGSF